MHNFHDFFSDIKEKRSPYYTEERWFPHCTIAYHESIEKCKELLSYVIDNFEPQIATVAEIGLIELIYEDNKCVEYKTINCKILN